MAMTSMKLTAEEAKEENSCMSTDDAPAYPYGLCLNLDDEVLAKLGITTLPAVGSKMMLQATVEVTANSQYENQDGKDISISLQITDMDLSGDHGPSAATVLYGAT